ncbi:MAG TPA: hypothetical protein VFE32_12575 [Puia sp.]|jgi:hypothetical protein|nr:hypothetical protein [Puia sp.]
MKNFSLAKHFFSAFLFFSCVIPSIYGQATMTTAPAATMTTVPPAASTAIRSVVAQGGQLRMLLHIEQTGVYQLEIHSMDGDIVFQQTLQEQAGEAEQAIPFGDRAHGVYVVNLAGASGQSSRQVMW